MRTSGTETFDIVFGWIIFWGYCNISFSAICIMGLSTSGDTGHLIVFCFIPALPLPNLGLIWGTCFAPDLIICFIKLAFPVLHLDLFPYLCHVLMVKLCL